MCQIERVRYSKCPLVEVAYQLNFPTILSIEAEMPAKFQNEIRKTFPQYQIQTEQENEITVNITGEEINPMFRHRPVRKLHQFISEDGTWKITLAKNQLAISTLKYEQWEDMMQRFEQPLKAFAKVYDQTYFERVGLTEETFNLDPVREDGFCEISVTWYDNQDAFDVIMSQKSERRNEIQFQGGAAELDRIELTTKMKMHFLAGRLNYERRPTSNNQYHGNLLIKDNIPKQLKRLIKFGLTTLAADKIYPNPNV